VDEADKAPSDLPSRVAASTAFGIVGPIAIALVIGLALAATSTPAPDNEFYAYLLYAATAVYLAGLIWDVFSAALNAARSRRHPTAARNYSSCLFGLIPIGGGVVVLSALADGEGWIFDWWFVLLLLVVVNIADFALFSAISKRRTPDRPSP
jgi:hypothetical protein